MVACCIHAGKHHCEREKYSHGVQVEVGERGKDGRRGATLWVRGRCIIYTWVCFMLTNVVVEAGECNDGEKF